MRFGTGIHTPRDRSFVTPNGFLFFQRDTTVDDENKGVCSLDVGLGLGICWIYYYGSFGISASVHLATSSSSHDLT